MQNIHTVDIIKCKSKNNQFLKLKKAIAQEQKENKVSRPSLLNFLAYSHTCLYTWLIFLLVTVNALIKYISQMS